MYNFKKSFHFRSMKRFPFTLYIESGTNYVDHVSSNEFVIFTLISFQKSVIVKWTLESLRNGDGNENGKKAKQQLCTCITLFYTCQFTHCTTTTWNCLISRLEEDVNTRRLSFLPWAAIKSFKTKPHKNWNSIHCSWKSKRMLATYKRRMRNNNLEIMIVGSSCRPQQNPRKLCHNLTN